MLHFRDGNLGPLDLDIGFNSPTGIGLKIEAGPVHGGGFLRHEQGRYTGILQLSVFNVAVNAVAVLETRLPGGTPAYSFLLLITAQFPPIQLGLGFTLNGLGGIAGLHRTVAADPLRASLRDGSAGGLLFPPDPVRNATRLLGDLTRFLPAAADRYVFGPVAKLGYGTPRIVEADLGVVLELPAPFRIVLLGVLRARFPNPEAPVVRINLDALGVLDLGARTFSLDASLYDSRVAAFDLAGDMALRLAWGEQPTFALAVGGFNPHFTPPPAFPTLRRLALALGSGSNPRIALQAYFALTSNTLQFGASASLYAAVAGFSVDGGLSFDALILFDPFGFRVDIAAHAALSGFGMRLASIRIEGLLEGPTPWHVTAHAHVSVLFFDIQVDVDARFGDAERPALPPEIHPWNLLKPELESLGNWAPALPPAALRVVSFRTPQGESAATLLDPAGGVEITQRRLPLARPLAKVGERRVAGGPRALTPTRFVIGERNVLGSATPVDAPFAPGQFRDLTEAERLSLPSFEPMPAGYRVTTGAVTCGEPAQIRLEYESVLVGEPDAGITRLESYQPNPAALGAALRAEPGVASLRRAGLQQFAPEPGAQPRVSLREERYLAATTDELEPVRLISPGPAGVVAAAIAERLVVRPAERGYLQRIPAHESDAVEVSP